MLFKTSVSRMDLQKERRKKYRRRWMSISRAVNKDLHAASNNANCTTSSDDDEAQGRDFSQNKSVGTCGLGQEFIESSSFPNINMNQDLSDDSDSSVPMNQNEDIINEEWNWDMIDQHIEITDSEDEGEGDSSTILTDLSEWATENLIKQNALDKLLKILIKNGHKNLPSTARTLLQTKRHIDTQVVSDMEYYNFGLEKGLKTNLEKYPCELISQVNRVEISLNIDGLPLFKSSKKALWPVLCGINLKPMKVFAVTLTLGTSKPQSLDFLNEVINELDILLQRGIMLNEKHIDIGLKCIVCDAPAKAMIKGVKLYSGYCGCDRCGQRGVWKGRMTYPEIENLPYRTDLSFRNQTQPEHHRTRSPFCDLPIDMIKSFPIDYMHQACLGVMKRLLLLWMRGKKKETKISFGHIEEISTRLVQLSKFIPKKFARKPRGLDEIDYWKATEYRQFLLYTGKLVLKGVLKKELYEHFLSFSVAMTILVSPVLVENYVEYAKELLVYFVSQAQILYGEEILVYNVHSMVHLADDAKEYGCLDNCAAFSFENHMQHLKKMIRSGKNPLSQIIKRISELENLQSKKVETVIPNICNKKPNNAFVLNNHTCCEVVGEINGGKSILCRVYSRGEAIFNMPCDSRIIGGYRFEKRFSQMKMLDVGLLNRQAIEINKDVDLHVTFLAILHDF
ncbi:uncharacterized protein LOC143051667 isoform X1 [Mytilus galloprovincialis]|uniref:uncharacterized protein LOC143051667 isoform X1 n=1 Tax=Mytilus galloprovincialis TaxID=29158 RepID=UPI003F7C1BF2